MNLRERLSNQGALSLAETERYLKQIIVALSQAQINHHAIKAENILLDERGNASLSVASIESASQESPVNTLGILLYEMLTGTQANQPLPDIRKLRPDLPPELNTILQKTSAKETYPNAEVLLADFARLKNQAASPKLEANRQAMLQNVYSFWVEGVLEDSLHKAVQTELGTEANYELQYLLKELDAPQERIEAEAKLLDVYERLKGKMLILGEAGSGKTRMLLRLAKELLERASKDEAHPLPVVFNLSSYKGQAFESWMLDELNRSYHLPRKIGQDWLSNCQILPLLDGLDELNDEGRKSCLDALEAFRKQYPFVDMVITAPMSDYKPVQERLKLNGLLAIGPLRQQAIRDYLGAVGEAARGLSQMLEQDEKLRALLSSPLMLDIAVLAYHGKSSTEIPSADSIETLRKVFFDAYTRRLIENGAYPEAKTKQYLKFIAQQMKAESIYYPEQMQPSILGKLGLKRLFYDVGLPIVTGFAGWLFALLDIYFGIYVFAFVAVLFITITELFTGVFLNSQNYMLWLQIAFGLLPAAFFYVYKRGKGDAFRWSWKMKSWLLFSAAFLYVPLTIGAMFVTLRYGYIDFGQVVLQLLFIIGLGLLAALPGFFFGFFASFRYLVKGKVEVFEVRRWSWKTALVAGLDWLIPAFLIAGFVAVLPTLGHYMTISGAGYLDIWSRPPSSTAFFFTATAILGIAISFSGMLLSGFRKKLPGRPHEIKEGLRRYWLRALFGAVATVIVSQYIILSTLNLNVNLFHDELWPIYRWRFLEIDWVSLIGFYVPVLLGIIFSLGNGGYAAAQHLTLRMALASGRDLPMNILRFLDFARSRHLLRRAGSGYIFMHRQLLDYFARL